MQSVKSRFKGQRECQKSNSLFVFQKVPEEIQSKIVHFYSVINKNHSSVEMFTPHDGINDHHPCDSGVIPLEGGESNASFLFHVVKCFAAALLCPFHRHFFFSKMPKIVCSKTCTTPRRPFEKERLNQELKIIGEYGLRNKREVWRVKYTLAKIRKAARELLTLEEKDPRRLFEGNALLRRLVRIGVLDESRMKLDYVLGLRIEDFLERRLQTQVFKLGLAKSIHHARVLIRQRHIR